MQLWYISRYQIRIVWNRWHAPGPVRWSLGRTGMAGNIFGTCDVFSDNERPFSTTGGTILFQARDPTKLIADIEEAIDEHLLKDACKLFEHHLQMNGFPRKSIFNKLITKFAESHDAQLLEKAYGFTERAIKESKQDVLEKVPLILLSFGLAKCGLPVPASTIIRRLIQIKLYPPVTCWSCVVGLMSLSAAGSYLSAELFLEMGRFFQGGKVDPRKKSNATLIAMKPNSTAVKLTLAGCLVFGATRKAEKLIDMAHQIGIKGDASLVIIMAHIYERNGRREELRKLQRHMGEAGLNDLQCRQFHDCLLRCHLKHQDLESATGMVLKMLRNAKEARNSLATATLIFPVDKKFPSGVGHASLENFSRSEAAVEDDSRQEKDGHSMPCERSCSAQLPRDLEAEAKEMLGVLLEKVQQVHHEFITTEQGILQPTETTYVKLAKAFLDCGKTKELVSFFKEVERDDSPRSCDDSVLLHVVDSCISIGWLDKAHDILDEMRLAGAMASSSAYARLLKAYVAANQEREGTSLVRDAQRAGIQLDASCYKALIRYQVRQRNDHEALRLFREMKSAKMPRIAHHESDMVMGVCFEGGEEEGFRGKLLKELKDQQTTDVGVHYWNNVIHFFCRKRLMKDAQGALKKMMILGHTPNAQTFHSLVTGYSAMSGKYVEVTELWGKMKALLSSAPSFKFDQELLDSVLDAFVRGGFFNQANEVVLIMEKNDMFIDRHKYEVLFLKYHKTFCKAKPPEFQTETQLKKKIAALEFQKRVGLS